MYYLYLSILQINKSYMGKKRGYVDHFSNAVRSFENDIIKFETTNVLKSKNLLERKSHDPNYLYRVDEIYFNAIKNNKKYSIKS